MMLPRKPLRIVSALIFLLALVVAVGIRTAEPPIAARPSCTVTFLDVGQGDAVLIQTSDRQDVLIDGGPSARISRELGKYFGFGNNEIELGILTHPDADHLAGMLAVVEEWPITTIMTTGVVTDTALYKQWKTHLDSGTSAVVPVQAGQKFQLGKVLAMEIIWPDRSWNGVPYAKKATDGRGGINDTSIGARITCAGSSILAIGDASDAVELALLGQEKNLHADLLKIGHHGSRYSTAHEFLLAVRPALAVILVGAENRYGHPHPAVLERLRVLKIPVFRTDIQHTLQFVSVPGGWEVRS